MAPRCENSRGLDIGGGLFSHAMRNVHGRPAMSVRQRGNSYEVRWTLGGRKRSRTFLTREDAEKFDARVKRQKRIKTAAFELETVIRSDLAEQVYVVQGGGMVKIGVSLQPLGRLAALQAGSPISLEVIWRIGCPNARKLERALHRRYKAHRAHGEWFTAAPVLADLAGLADLGAFQFQAPNAPGNRSRTGDALILRAVSSP